MKGCSFRGEWLDTLCYIHTMEYYAAVKSNEVLYALIWVDFEDVLLTWSNGNKNKNKQIGPN